MKNLIRFSLFTVFLAVIQAPVSAQISVVGYVQTTGAGDTYPTHLDSLQKGGYRIAKDRAERNGIPDQRRKAGMLVYEQSSDSTFILKGGIANINWVPYTLGSTFSGAGNYLPKYATASTLGNSLLFDNGTNIGIGTALPGVKLDVVGAARLTANDPLTLLGVQLGTATSTDSVLTINTGMVKKLPLSSFNVSGSWVPYVAAPGLSFVDARNHIMANPDNMNGGGIAISDDGGFYDYNDGFITFKTNANGLKVNGNINITGATTGTSASFSGNVGVGINSTGFPLNLASSFGDKISLYGISGNHYGFGIQSNLLQIHTDAATADIAFGYGRSAAFTERMRLTGAGNLTVMGTGTFDKVYATNNGNGTNFYVGDDMVLGDINQSNFMSLRGRQNSDRAYLVFGDADITALGRTGAGPLEYGGEVFLGGSLGSGSNMSGNGVRMMWMPHKAAFRAGEAQYNNWDDGNVGQYSTAFGVGSLVPGWNGTAFGNLNNVGGSSGTAFGYNNIVNGSNAMAGGSGSSANGNQSFSFGSANQADGENSVALGYIAHANGYHSFAFGDNVYANNSYSFAMGTNCGSYANGAFTICDVSGGAFSNSFTNMMQARFAGGYRYYSNAAGTIGATLKAGQNFWDILSDSNKKENFLPVDGEKFLKGIAKMPLTSWNYKTQDPKQFRHYGPMAQDFFAAFGKDELGVIGDDTSINQADFNGVNFIAIKALENRSTRQAAEIAKLKSGKSETDAEIEKLKATIEELKKAVMGIKNPTVTKSGVK